MLIEIMQDCAGVIEHSNKIASGFYTDGIEDCLVTAYTCDSATVFVHDSGQLSVNNICDLVKRYGTVKKIVAFFWNQQNYERHEPLSLIHI